MNITEIGSNIDDVFFLIGAAILGAVVSIGGNLLTQKLFGGSKQQSQARIGGVDPAPPYRYAYGRTRLGGFRVFTHVSDDTLYLGFLLNSRPSDSIEKIEFDARNGIRLTKTR